MQTDLSSKSTAAEPGETHRSIHGDRNEFTCITTCYMIMVNKRLSFSLVGVGPQKHWWEHIFLEINMGKGEVIVF